MNSPIAARRRPSPAGPLDAVRGVDDDGTAEALHDGDGADVDDEIVVAERRARARSGGSLALPALSDLLDGVLHVVGREELALFDVDRLARSGRGQEQIGLPAEEGRDLEDVEDRGRGALDLRRLVDVGEDGNAELVALISARMSQALLQARAAERIDRRAVGLVEGGLEDERDVRASAQTASSAPGEGEGLAAAFDDARAGDQEKLRPGRRA